jgi:hypothetical protein
MQHFETISDFTPPLHSDGEIIPEVLNFVLTADAPGISERSYVERFLRTISTGKLTYADDVALTLGDDKPRRDISTPMPPDLVNHYRNVFDATIKNPNLINVKVLSNLALQIRGKIIKIPAPDVRKDDFKMMERVAATDRYAALAYANLLLLSNYRVDLCRCAYCNIFFLAQPKIKGGRTSRVTCNSEHGKKHRAASAAERANAARAGETWPRWREILHQHPGITPGNWEKMKMENIRTSKRHK